MSVSLISGLKSRQSTSRGGCGTAGSERSTNPPWQDALGNHCLHLTTLVISSLGSSFCGLTTSCSVSPCGHREHRECRQQHLAAWEFCGWALRQAELLKKAGTIYWKTGAFYLSLCCALPVGNQLFVLVSFLWHESPLFSITFVWDKSCYFDKGAAVFLAVNSDEGC